MRKVKMFTALVLALLLALSLVPVTSAEKVAPPERVTLELLAPSPVSQINDLDAVLEEIYKQTDDTLNIRINYTFTTFDDIGQKASLKMSSGEPLDITFTAQWTTPSLAQMVSKGLLVNLDPYIDSGDYPGLAEYFNGDYRRNNSVKDANGESHLYALPFTSFFSGGAGIYYRKDLADKYGIEITDYDSLTKFYDAVLENEPGMVPFSFLGSNDSINTMVRTIYRSEPQLTQHNEFTVDALSAIIGEDGKAYVARTVVPELDDNYFSKLPEFRQKEDKLLGYNLAREWYEKGYLEKDCLSQKDFEGQFMAGRAASYPRGIDTFMETALRIKGALPGAELGCFVYEEGARFDIPKVSGSDFRAWNFAAIPTTSKNADRAVGFLNWLFESKDNHDLMELGIEGKHWIKVGETGKTLPENVDPNTNYNFYGYILTWHPSLIRDDISTPESVANVYQKLRDPDFYYRRPDAGFTFVTDSIKTEIAKINDLKSLMRAVANGVVQDTEGEIAKIQAQYDQAGYEIIASELENQLNEFLKEYPYEGQ